MFRKSREYFFEMKEFLVFIFVMTNFVVVIGDSGNANADILAHHGEYQFIEEFPLSNPEFFENMTNKERWLLSENLAQYLDLSVVHSVSIPITFNLIFVGFDGSGHNGIELNDDDYKSWFEHLEHSLHHTVVPVGEHQTTTAKFVSPKTAVDYSIEMNVLKLCSLVNTIIEDALLWNVRPEEPIEAEKDTHTDTKKEQYYVDAFKFSSLLNNLLHFLGLNDSYTLFILNPNSPVERDEVYGYRTGFSSHEIGYLYQNEDFKAVNIPRKKPETEKAPQKQTQSKYMSMNMTKSGNVKQVDLVKESEAWCQWYLEAQKKSRFSEGSAVCDAQEDNPNCLFKERPSSKLGIVEIAKEIISNGSISQNQYLYRVQNDLYIYEECLVDAWIGHERFAFVDLTAGPFTWGPTIAGEGIRTYHTLPKVPAWKQLENEEKAKEKFQTAKGGGVAPNTEEKYEEFKAESSLLKAFWQEYCESGDRTSDFCIALESRMKYFFPDNGKTERTGNYEPIIGGHDEEGTAFSMVTDEFLSQLGAIISTSIRHLVVPPSPLFTPFYAERVTYHFFIIRNHKAFDPKQHFDYEEFKEEISKLKLAKQEFVFSLKEISMVDDPALTMAFAKSLQTAILPNLNGEGEFSTYSQLYLDSKELQHHLKLLNTDQHTDEDEEDDDDDARRLTKHIPIFLFSLDYAIPVLLDKYYQAKALSDMVLIVQTNFPTWESRVTCNKDVVNWDMRNPLKAALAATALLLGGLVPTHIGYNEATQSAQQNWLWSVGDSPLSYTSSKHHFSSFNKDIVFRNYVVHALNDSLQIVNEAIGILMNQRPVLDNARAIEEIPLDEISEAFNRLKDLWIFVSRAVSRLDFTEATSRLGEIHRLSRSFKKKVQEAAETIELVTCMPPGQAHSKLEWLLPLAMAVDLIFVLAFVLLRKTSRRDKLKIN